MNFSNKKNITFQKFFENQCPTIFGNSWYMNFWKFMVPKIFATLGLFNRLAQAGGGPPFLGPFFGIQCPTIFCDFGLFNRLAQAGGGGALLYDISLPKTYRPKLLPSARSHRFTQPDLILPSATLSRPQLTFSGTSLSPLTASKTSQGIYKHSHGLYWHSHGLYKHYQSLCSLQVLSWLVIELSNGCESVVEAVRVLYSHSRFGHTYDLHGHSHGLISPLTAFTDIFMASTTLTNTANTLTALQQSQSLYRVALSQALSPPLQALLWPLRHSHGLYKHSVVRSLQLFFNIYICTAHIL